MSALVKAILYTEALATTRMDWAETIDLGPQVEEVTDAKGAIPQGDLPGVRQAHGDEGGRDHAGAHPAEEAGGRDAEVGAAHLPRLPQAGQESQDGGVMDDFKVGDKIAAAVLSYKHAHLRVGVIEKIHAPTRSVREVRYTIRDEKGNPFVVSRARSVRIGDGFRA